MEVLISVVLLGLISMFVTSTILQTKKNNGVFEAQNRKDGRLSRVVDTLYRDILESKSISVSGKKSYSVLKMKSENSLYGISEPYVLWVVLKKNHTLVRMESAKRIVLPLDKKFQKYVFVDKGVEDCSDFSLNLSKKQGAILAFIHLKNGSKTIFEIKLSR